jgi:hypothetical protein
VAQVLKIDQRFGRTTLLLTPGGAWELLVWEDIANSAQTVPAGLERFFRLEIGQQLAAKGRGIDDFDAIERDGVQTSIGTE